MTKRIPKPQVVFHRGLFAPTGYAVLSFRDSPAAREYGWWDLAAVFYYRDEAQEWARKWTNTRVVRLVDWKPDPESDGTLRPKSAAQRARVDRKEKRG